MQQSPYQNLNGQLRQVDFINCTGGTNLVDSVFKIGEDQAADGYNFDYILTGGVRKRLGPVKINSSADSQARSLGFGLYAPISGTSKSIFRAAGTKLELFSPSVPSFVALTQDNASASSSPFSATSNVFFSQFSNGTTDIDWAIGGGLTLPIGAYSTTKFTQNGVIAPSGSISVTVNAHNSGSWTASGTYYYAVVLHKASTGVTGNAALDVSATTVNTDDTVTVNLAGITAFDQTTYDQVWIYRSARSGVSAFTTGNLIAQIASSSTSFVDKGDLGNPDISSNVNVPRVNSTVLDQSVLPTQTYIAITNWQTRLAVASGNKLYISDSNKSESWPTTNYITVPSAGPITALGRISYTSPQANALSDLLVIFKERELWVLSGTNFTNWNLVQIDTTGCPGQGLVVPAQGFLAWIDYRGVHVWDGTSKPFYVSRLIEPMFQYSGDLDKSQLVNGIGQFFRRENQIVWYLSSKTFGVQMFAIKMDVRLTLMKIQQQLTGRIIDAVFTRDNYAFPVYAALSYIPLNGGDEQLLLGDSSGFCYNASNGYSDGGANFSFTYKTAPLHCGDPNTEKQFHKVIVWVQDIGNWNLELDYWADYKTASIYETTQALPLSTENQAATSLWDLAVWDTSTWDGFSSNVIPIVFNLQSGANNSSIGKAIQLQFKNGTSNQPIVIHGFSLIYSLMGGITQ